MFICSQLGQTEPFGHQLFKIAATVGMATRHGVPYLFPRWHYADLFRTPVPQTEQLPTPDIVLAQRGLHFIDISLSLQEPLVIDLDGAFQSDIYFAHCGNAIVTSFAPATPIVEAIAMGHGDRLRGAVTCAIVASRIDYSTRETHSQTESHKFYDAAMSCFDADTEFLVMSDDIDWCRQHIRRPRVTFLPQSGWVHNFFLGTMCQHAITSSTTFGWWCAYLNSNPDKRVIAPKSWVSPEYQHLGPGTPVPHDWETL